MRRRPILALPFAAAAVLVLAGCVPALPFGPGGPFGADRGERSDRDQVAGSCVNGRASISTPGEYDLDDCAEVIVEGSDIRLDVDDVDSLTVRGDRQIIDAGSVDAVTVEGNDNDLEVDRVESLSIRGDRNEFHADDPSDQVTVEGNDNVVSGGSAVVTDRGDRNRIDPRDITG